MYTSIVVGTDGSETAQEAVRHAAELAKRFDAELHVVSCFKPVRSSAVIAVSAEAMSFKGAEVLEKAEKEIAVAVDSMLGRLADDLKADDIKVDCHGVSGDPADTLIEIAEARKADLIVVGNKGMTGARRILGSIPNRVAHHAPCAVLIVHTTQGR